MNFLPAPTTFCRAAGRGSDRGKSIELQANCLAELATPPALKPHRTPRGDRLRRARCRLAGVIAAVVVAAAMFSAAHAAQDSTPGVPTPKTGQVSTAGTANAKLALFQDFVNGKVPVKEAVVYRKITKPDGAVDNQDWWRFGCQENTWYCQRLQPDKNDASQLVPHGDQEVGGASYTHLWIIDDRNVHLAVKESADGSLLDKYPLRNLMQSTLSLGLPRRTDKIEVSEAPIEWNGTKFSTIYYDGPDEKGHRVTVVLEGEVKLGIGGAPTVARWAPVRNLPGGAVTFEYGADTNAVPSVFAVKYSDEDLEYRYEFLSLTLGSNNLSETEGYVPALFSDLRLERNVKIWTNRQDYSLINGKLMSNARPMRIYGQGPKRGGLITLVSLVGVTATILALGYRRWAKERRTNEQKGNKT